MDIVKNNMFSQIYEVDCFQKEFMEMSDEKFVFEPPYPRYQKRLIGKLRVLEEFKEKNSSDYDRHIKLAQRRIKVLERE